ncbi:MAG: hypothetical protein ACFFAO_06890 [Candidatus Hermodarchaeota archaeon]
MQNLLKSFELSDEAISFYLNLYGKNLLTLNEIQILNPKISQKKLIELINLLFQSKLLIKIQPKDSSILGHFLAIPPFFTINSLIDQIKNEVVIQDGSTNKIEVIIEKVFNKQSKVELEKIYKDFQVLQNDVNKDIKTIKKELDELLDQIEGKKKAPDFLKKYEDELKNIINSELASIVIILLQMKADFQEKLKNVGITNQQWSSLKDEIKDTLALGIHEKSEELGNIITEEFEEIRNLVKEKFDIAKDRFEQKSVYLGILNMFKNEIDKFHKALLLKKNNLNLDLQSLQKSLNNEIIDLYNKTSKTASKNIVVLEQFFQGFFENYKEYFNLTVDKFWTINNKAKLNEEILNLLKNSKREILMIIPEVNGFVPLKPLKKYSENLNIKIIASDSHESELVNSIIKNDNIKYEKLKNKDFIGLLGDDTHLIIGIYQEDKMNPLKNVIGFGTVHKPIINALMPVILEKIDNAKPTAEMQISNGFNYIIENINEIKGKKISKTLQEVLDLAFEMKGISLDVLELKILISQLKSMNSIIDVKTKQQVINKIIDFNEKFSKIELNVPPELTSPTIIESEIDMTIANIKKGVTPENTENLTSMFELFLEKLDNLKGRDISEQIGNMIEMILNFQGFSNILEWKKNLSEVDENLQEPFKEKLREDFTSWKNELLSTTLSREVIQQETLGTQEIQTDANLQVDEPIEEEYFSPALAELEQAEEETLEETSKSQNVSEIFLEINQNLNDLTGTDISTKLQTIMDIILETKGYSIALKDMRQWISKLRMIKTPIVDDIKSMLKEKLLKWEKEAQYN